MLDLLPPFFLSLPCAALENSSFPQAGHHHFDSTGEPVFDLSASTEGVLVGAKVGDIQAPKGTSSTGSSEAVDWLALKAKSGTEGELSSVYRIETAGGKPLASCDGQPSSFEVDYSALYYFTG